MTKRPPRRTVSQRILGDPSEPVSQALVMRLVGVLLAAALSLAVYIWHDLTKTVESQVTEEKETHTRLWQKNGEVQGRQAEQGTARGALNAEAGAIKDK